MKPLGPPSIPASDLFIYLLHVSITALSTQMEVKRPLKQLSITPQVPWRIGGCCHCVPCVACVFFFFYFLFHTSSVTRAQPVCIMFTWQPAVYCAAATLNARQISGHSECAEAKPWRVCDAARDSFPVL